MQKGTAVQARGLTVVLFSLYLLVCAVGLIILFSFLTGEWGLYDFIGSHIGTLGAILLEGGWLGWLVVVAIPCISIIVSVFGSFRKALYSLVFLLFTYYIVSAFRANGGGPEAGFGFAFLPFILIAAFVVMAIVVYIVGSFFRWVLGLQNITQKMALIFIVPLLICGPAIYKVYTHQPKVYTTADCMRILDISIDKDSRRMRCLLSVAEKNSSVVKMCEGLGNGRDKTVCYAAYAYVKSDPTICKSLETPLKTDGTLDPRRSTPSSICGNYYGLLER